MQNEQEKQVGKQTTDPTICIRLCNICNKEIDKSKRSGTLFCSDECSQINIKANKRNDDLSKEKKCETCDTVGSKIL